MENGPIGNVVDGLGQLLRGLFDFLDQVLDDLFVIDEGLEVVTVLAHKVVSNEHRNGSER